LINILVEQTSAQILYHRRPIIANIAQLELQFIKNGLVSFDLLFPVGFTVTKIDLLIRLLKDDPAAFTTDSDGTGITINGQVVEFNFDGTLVSDDNPTITYGDLPPDSYTYSISINNGEFVIAGHYHLNLDTGDPVPPVSPGSGAIEFTDLTVVIAFGPEIVVTGDLNAVWGQITGTLSNQTDLQAELDAKADAVALSVHLANLANPHVVTQTQVGLNEVDNTSDVQSSVFNIWRFNGGLSGDPGTGNWGVDTSDLSLATEIRIHKINVQGTDQTLFFGIVNEFINLQAEKVSDVSISVIYQLLDMPVAVGDYFTIDITHIASVGTFVATDEFNFNFFIDAIAIEDAIAASTGDVTGPASATDNAIVQFDGITGKLVKDSATPLLTAGIGNASLLNDGSYGKAALRALTTQAANTAVVGDTDIYYADPTLNIVNFNLPAASAELNELFVFVNTDTTAGPSTFFMQISPDGSDTINGAITPFLVSNRNEYVHLTANTITNWQSIAQRTFAFAALGLDTPTTQAITVTPTLLSAFDVVRTEAPGRLLANLADSSIDVQQVLLPQDGYLIRFAMTAEFDNNAELFLTLRYNGIDTIIAGQATGLGNNNKVGVNLTAIVAVTIAADFEIFVSGSTTFTLEIENLQWSMNRQGG